jgi:hypothetical protein
LRAIELFATLQGTNTGHHANACETGNPVDSSHRDMTELADAGETVEPEALPRYSPRGLARYALGRLHAWSQQRYARRGARRAHTQYQRLRRSRPALRGEDLYAAFVCQRNAIDDAAARALLRRAEQSFAAWPDYRDLNFQDVVKYLVIADYLASHQHLGGTTVDMGRVIGHIIPRTW